MEAQSAVPALIEECHKIHNDAKISADAQYLSAARYQKIALWFQVVPAVASAVTGTLAIGVVMRPYLGWVAAATAVITAVATILNPAQRSHSHLSAAKAFTVVKNEARSTGDVFGRSMPQQEFQRAVQALLTRYNDLIRLVPQSEAWAIRQELLKRKNKELSVAGNGEE